MVADLEVEARAARRPRAGSPRRPRLAVGRVGVGRFGSVAASASRRSSTSASSACSALTSAGDALHPRDHLARRRRPRASRAAISSEASFWRGAAPLDLGQQLAAAGVELEQLVERLGRAAARERRPGRARVLADRSQVEHRRAGALLPEAAACCCRTGSRSRSPGFGGRSTSAPAYSATNSATASASSPTTMFCGMIAPEKPPLRIA